MFFPLHYTIFCIRIDFRQYLESEETGGMKIIKRNGSEEVFDINKIIKAVKKADINSEERSLSDGQIEDIAEYVEFKCKWMVKKWE